MAFIAVTFLLVAVLLFFYLLNKTLVYQKDHKDERGLGGRGTESDMRSSARWFFRGYCLIFLGVSSALLIALDCYNRSCHCGVVNNASTKKRVVVCPVYKSQQRSTKLSGADRTNHAKTMALEKHFNPGRRYMNNVRSKHVNKAENGLWPIPKNLIAELAEAEISYFQSIMQPEGTGTCGSRCVANALSICDAQEKDALDAKTAYAISKNYQPRRKTCPFMGGI